MQEHELRMIQTRTTCLNIITSENKLIETFTNDKQNTSMACTITLLKTTTKQPINRTNPTLHF